MAGPAQRLRLDEMRSHLSASGDGQAVTFVLAAPQSAPAAADPAGLRAPDIAVHRRGLDKDWKDPILQAVEAAPEAAANDLLGLRALIVRAPVEVWCTWIEGDDPVIDPAKLQVFLNRSTGGSDGSDR